MSWATYGPHFVMRLCSINNRGSFIPIPLFSKKIGLKRCAGLCWSNWAICGIFQMAVACRAMVECKLSLTVNVTCGQVATMVDQQKSTQRKVCPLSFLLVWTRRIIHFLTVIDWRELTNLCPYDLTVWPFSNPKSKHILGGLQCKTQIEIHMLANYSVQKLLRVLHCTVEFVPVSGCWVITHLVIKGCQMLIGSYSLYEDSLTPNSTVTSKYVLLWSFSPLFKKIFDLFITWAVAVNGGLREEVLVVWSGGSDTGVSFITVGHSLLALMEIIMYVHNCPEGKGVWIQSACQATWSVFFYLGVKFAELGSYWIWTGPPISFYI